MVDDTPNEEPSSPEVETDPETETDPEVVPEA